jgi:hypothetical protein
MKRKSSPEYDNAIGCVLLWAAVLRLGNTLETVQLGAATIVRNQVFVPFVAILISSTTSPRRVVLACHSAMSRDHYSLAMMPGAKKLRVETRK